MAGLWALVGSTIDEGEDTGIKYLKYIDGSNVVYANRRKPTSWQ